MARLTRIETLLGVPLAEIDEVAIGRLVTGSVREDQDLEFKQQLYGATDGAKRDLAGDVAAMANTVGGLLVLGVREANAVAVQLTLVELSDREEVRIRQVLAERVAPHPEVTLHTVTSGTDPSRGYYLIEVPRSPLAPHAVRVNNALRYPRRDGTHIRWLAESEVADAYRNRFALAREQVERVATIRQEGEASLPDLGKDAWLSLALTPTLSGQMPLTQQAVKNVGSFWDSVRMPRLATQSHLRDRSLTPRAGFRRVEVLLGQDAAGRPRYGLLHLHVDGSGFVGVQVGRELPDNLGHEDGVAHVPDVLLTQETVNAISLLAHHAVDNCGASGEALVEATLLAGMPMQLGQVAGLMSVDTWGHRIETAPVGRRTVDLDEIISSSKGLVIASRLVLNDLVQGFGIAESPQLTADGALRISYFHVSERHRLSGDDAGFDLEITSDKL